MTETLPGTSVVTVGVTRSEGVRRRAGTRHRRGRRRCAGLDSARSPAGFAPVLRTTLDL